MVKYITNHCWGNNQKVSNIRNNCKLARKRRQVYVVPTHGEEDGEGDPKDHSSRTADFSCALGSQSLKINNKTSIPTGSLEGLHEESRY